MSCQIHHGAEGELILEGDLQHDQAVYVEAEGRAHMHGRKRMIVDLSGLTRIDSAALSVFLSWTRYGREHQVGVILRKPCSQLLSLVTLSGIDDLLVLEH
ncbi:STAS domain-containing protein [Spongorhabdus nitratireducens]